ncbi:MAG: glycoside hydrolase family 113, partial [Planctomycetota bacterium]
MNRFWASPKAGLTARSLACLLAAVAGIPALCGQGGPPKPFLARAKAMRGADLVVLEDGRTVRLQGISLPPPVVRPEGFVQRLQAFVRAELSNREVWVVPEAHTEPGETADFVALLRQSRDGPSVNAAVLSRGLALLSCRTETVTNMPELVAAARAAQTARAGWFARSKPRKLERLGFLNGAVLGLHYREEGRDYHRQLDELAAMGFRHVCLLFSAFLRRVDSVRLDRHHERTVRDARLIETIGYAKQKGFSVMLLPIVLLLEAGDEDWRGTLKPRDEKRCRGDGNGHRQHRQRVRLAREPHSDVGADHHQCPRSVRWPVDLLGQLGSCLRAEVPEAARLRWHDRLLLADRETGPDAGRATGGMAAGGERATGRSEAARAEPARGVH